MPVLLFQFANEDVLPTDDKLEDIARIAQPAALLIADPGEAIFQHRQSAFS